MVQLFVEGCDRIVRFGIPEVINEQKYCSSNLVLDISESFGIPVAGFYITTKGGKPLNVADDLLSFDRCTLSLKLRICGGIDFQHREGSKIGGGGMCSQPLFIFLLNCWCFMLISIWIIVRVTNRWISFVKLVWRLLSCFRFKCFIQYATSSDCPLFHVLFLLFFHSSSNSFSSIFCL